MSGAPRGRRGNRWAALLLPPLALFVACSPRGENPPTATTAAASVAPLPRVRLPSGAELTVELAITPEERAIGLMFRESLARDRGVLFVFEELSPQPFWMKNCRFPIDIVWLDAERRVVSVSANTPPCAVDPCPNYPPAGPALFVLEMAAGLAAESGLAPGTRLEVANLPVERLPEAARRALGAPAPPATSRSAGA